MVVSSIQLYLLSVEASSRLPLQYFDFLDVFSKQKVKTFLGHCPYYCTNLRVRFIITEDRAHAHLYARESRDWLHSKIFTLNSSRVFSCEEKGWVFETLYRL